MEKFKIIFYCNRGYALFIAILTLIVITVLGLAIIINSTTEIKISGNLRTKTEAFYLAEAGAQRALRHINDNIKKEPLYYNDLSHLGTIFSDVKLGNGIYTVEIKFDGKDKNGNNRLSLISTGRIPSSGAKKKIKEELAPSYTNANPFRYAAFGINGITFSENSSLVDSYDSAKGAYGGLNVGINGDIGTNSIKNGAIFLSNSTIKGDVLIGPGGDISKVITQEPGAILSGSKKIFSKQEIFLPLKIPEDITHPSGIPPQGSALVLSGTESLTLGSGQYFFSSISIKEQGQLNINGNVTIFVTGNVDALGNGIVNTTGNPANFQIKVAGSSDVNIVGNNLFYGGVFAPDAHVTLSGNGALFGSVIGLTNRFTGNVQLHYDEALKKLNSGIFISSYRVLSWKEII